MNVWCLRLAVVVSIRIGMQFYTQRKYAIDCNLLILHVKSMKCRFCDIVAAYLLTEHFFCSIFYELCMVIKCWTHFAYIVAKMIIFIAFRDELKNKLYEKRMRLIFFAWQLSVISITRGSNETWEPLSSLSGLFPLFLRTKLIVSNLNRSNKSRACKNYA